MMQSRAQQGTQDAEDVRDVADIPGYLRIWRVSGSGALDMLRNGV
jgi:hypothetical protein